MNYSALQKNYEELQEQIQEAIKAMADKSQGYVQSAVDQFLEKYPFVHCVHWTQYTPHFMDGEECTFSVNDICFYIKFSEEDDLENMESYDSSPVYNTEDLESAKKDLEEAVAYTNNPTAWVEKYYIDYEKKYGRPAHKSAYNNPKPHPTDPKEAQNNIDEIQKFLDTYPETLLNTMQKDFGAMARTIGKIPEDVMKSVYGDHSQVIITLGNTEVDDFSHD